MNALRWMFTLPCFAIEALPTAWAGARVVCRAAPTNRQVYEGGPGLRQQGAGVLIGINGWRALHAVDTALGER